MSYKITETEVEAVEVSSTVGDTLTGTVAQNKQIFDDYPDLIVDKFNDLCDHVDDDFISQDELGTLANLTTDVKTDTVSAINELVSKQNTIETRTTFPDDTEGSDGDEYFVY